MMKNDQVYLEHILEAIGKIENFVTGTSKFEFERNVMVQDAVIRNIEIIEKRLKRSQHSLKNHIMKFPGLIWPV